MRGTENHLIKVAYNWRPTDRLRRMATDDNYDYVTCVSNNSIVERQIQERLPVDLVYL